MNIYQHIAFNPHFESITQVINRLGANPIWSLSHIVPITEYESVAVFEGWDSLGDDQAKLGKIPISETLKDDHLTATIVPNDTLPLASL